MGDQWTPATTPLPVAMAVNVTVEWGHRRFVCGAVWTGAEWIVAGDPISDLGLNARVVAWMPLPEPYRGEP